LKESLFRGKLLVSGRIKVLKSLRSSYLEVVPSTQDAGSSPPGLLYYIVSRGSL